MSSPSPSPWAADLLHRVNNLLGTIATQCEVAAAAGTLAAHRSALRLIAESAQRTELEVRRLRRDDDLTSRTAN